MHRFNFTKAEITQLPIPGPGKRHYFYDTRVRGLAVSVTPTGVKTFLVYRWLNNKPERITIGRFPDITVDHARTRAEEINGLIAKNINPAESKRVQRAEMTFGELFNRYFEQHAKV